MNWVEKDVRLGDFCQDHVRVPATWSEESTGILARLYLRNREPGLDAMVDRVMGQVRAWLNEHGLLTPTEAIALTERIAQAVIEQRAAFNSPVWFNVGVPGVPQVASACYLLDVEDALPAILHWYEEEGLIFQGGGGAGVNLSKLRASSEALSRGGTSSGPVSFMRGADASAGTIKSGGATRRAAKMVVLDVDHPDIEEFIWCKAREERKARALRDAGFDVSSGGADAYSLQYQNANNSVRVTDAFMQAVLDDADWELTARTTGETVKVVKARNLFHQIAQAAWECADPGIQFHDTINRWHTHPSVGPIRTTNPCAEVHLPANEACNLASVNLVAFLDEAGEFDADGFVAAVDDLITAMDAIALGADYPTPAIAANARAHRPLGLGFTNLGAALMRLGLPYDSHDGRTWAASVAALMCAAAWRRSALLAKLGGPFEGFEDDCGAVLRVLGMHREAMSLLSGPIAEVARQVMDEAIGLAEVHGVRNTQVTAIAPTGSISFLMGAETTGCEPAFALVTTKALVGGGTITQVVGSVAHGLRRLGYAPGEVEAIEAYVREHGSIVGAPGFHPEHAPVFATAVGDGAIRPEAHVDMVAALQPFLSGAASKTVNLPATATVENVEDIYLQAWRSGIKAIAVYRDASKATQVLTAGSQSQPVPAPARTARREPPKTRRAICTEAKIGGAKVYLHIGLFDDGSPAEFFVTAAKVGSTLSGALAMAAIAGSLALQHGVPVEALTKHWREMSWPPAGFTDDPDARVVRSIADWVARRLEQLFLGGEDGEVRAELDARVETESQPVVGECCVECGSILVRSGTCWSCPSCGATGGCG